MLLAFRIAPALLCLSASVASATVVSSFTSGTATTQSNNYVGEQFAITASGSYSNISFSFYTPSGAASALGNAYLFSAPFTGTESALSSTTSNLLGVGTSANGAYTFNNVVLNGGTVYYLYNDVSYAAGTLAGGGGAASNTEDLYALTSASTYVTNGAGISFNYSVSGTPAVAAAAVTPEPSALILLSTGLVGIGGMWRRRQA